MIDPTQPRFKDAKRIVVKIGSALVVDNATAAPRAAWLASVAADIAALRARGVEVVVVSSGAIALARKALGLTRRRLRLEEKQAAAAVGQIRLAGAWQEALAAHGLNAAQLLLTLEDSEDRRRYLNARATLATLINLGCVPVINENDTVATAEIRFGDNDRLAARVAEMIQADALLLLSDIDGLYTADPRKDPSAKKYETLRFSEVLERRLAVMDLTAMTMCMEHNLPVEVFDFRATGNVKRAVLGERIGTLIQASHETRFAEV